MQLIEFQDNKYEVKKTFDVNHISEENISKWKTSYNCELVLKNNNVFYFLKQIEDAKCEEVI